MKQILVGELTYLVLLEKATNFNLLTSFVFQLTPSLASP